MLKIWSQNELIDAGYELINGQIDDIDLSIADHDCLYFSFGICTGSFHIGFGHFCFASYSCKKDNEEHDYRDKYNYTSDPKMGEILIRIMQTLDISKLSEFKNTYLRIAYKRGKELKIIGNILYDVWFDIEDFYREYKDFYDKINQ